MITTELCIHPELTAPPASRGRGVYEIHGYPGGWRHWVAYDSHGIVRIMVGMHDRDVDFALVDRMERRLDELEELDRERQEA